MEGANAAFSSNGLGNFYDELAVDRVQAAFEAQNRDTLIYSGRLRQQNLYHTTRIVAATPNCLSSHVRRIFLSIECNDRPALIGALVDLFLVLKGRGRVLFERLLQQSSAVLGRRLMGTMKRTFLGDDVQRVMRLPLDHSVLVNGRTGTIYQFKSFSIANSFR